MNKDEGQIGRAGSRKSTLVLGRNPSASLSEHSQNINNIRFTAGVEFLNGWPGRSRAALVSGLLNQVLDFLP